MNIKIGFFGTPALAAAVLTACAHDPEISIDFVVSQADKPVGRTLKLTPSPVSQVAMDYNLPLFRPEKIRGNTDFLESIRGRDVDYFVVVAYGKILPKELLDIPRMLPINIHGSILPKHRGASPIQFALLSGDHQTGITIMRMDEGMDEGGALYTEIISIDSEETTETLFNKFSEKAPSVLIETLKKHITGDIRVIEQDHSLATYTRKIEKEDGRIDWSTWTADLLYTSWQGYTPWPGVWTYLKGKRCILTKCRKSKIEYVLKEGNRKNGEVFFVDKRAFVACVGSGAIEILEILIEGKPRRLAVDVLRPGDVFGTEA